MTEPFWLGVAVGIGFMAFVLYVLDRVSGPDKTTDTQLSKPR